MKGGIGEHEDMGKRKGTKIGGKERRKRKTEKGMVKGEEDEEAVRRGRGGTGEHGEMGKRKGGKER